MSWRGHVHTALPPLAHALAPWRAPRAVPWSTRVADKVVGDVPLTGFLHAPQGARTLVLLVHGLGGSAGSHYMLAGARAAAAAGCASLRLNLRGADRSGVDVYHAALTADLHAALAHPEVRRHERVVVLGWSLGGHLALRLALEIEPGQVAAVAAACAPLHLGWAAAAFDEAVAAPYRWHVLRSLRAAEAARARHRGVPADLRGLASLREWDLRVVVPRHGFASVEAYHREASVAPRLAELKVPCLLVLADDDPVVPPHVVRPALYETAAGHPESLAGHPGAVAGRPVSLAGRPGAAGLTVAWVPGGHLGFPPRVKLPGARAVGVAAGIVEWLLAA